MSTTLIDSPKNLNEGLRSLPGWRVAASFSTGYDDCCLVVPTFNRPRETMELIQILAKRENGPVEVVVADGSSQPDLDRQLKSWAANSSLPFELVYVRCPAGLTRQRNIGIDVSTRELVFFLDDDSRPFENYFRSVRQVFLDDRKKTIGAIGGSVLNELDHPISIRWRIRLATGLVPRVAPMTYASCGTSTPKALSRPFQGTRSVDLLPGCAFTFRREVFAKHRFSYFFEGYSQGEDMEMSLRVGGDWEVICCGDAELVHYTVPSARPPSFDKGAMEVRNKFVIWKRYVPNARLIDRIRFWGDVTLVVVFDLLHFLRRPWRGSHLKHAVGLVAGALGCLLSSPQFAEPTAHREYRLALGD
jgi:GT2 family glycosyltransferase